MELMMTNSRLPQPDIDTQIESLLDKYFGEPYPDYNMGLLPDEQDYDIVKEMRNYKSHQIKDDIYKAIKTLLDTAVQEARIDELDNQLPSLLNYSLNQEQLNLIHDRIKKLKSTSKEDK